MVVPMSPRWPVVVGIVVAILSTAQPSTAQVGDLQATVSGHVVTLTWTGNAEGWLVEAGPAPGIVSVSQAIGRSMPGLVATGVPAGIYHVRVRALVGGVAGPSSNEVVVTVGGCEPTQRRIDLRSRVTGTQISLEWNWTGIRPPSWQLEAGSAPGAVDIAVLMLPREQSEFVAIAPAGTYYLRIRRTDGCDEPSNEVRLQPGLPSALQCVVPLPPAGLTARAGFTSSFTPLVNSACQWTAESGEYWISLLTVQGVGGQPLRFTVSPLPGASGQIPIRTISGRYLLQVWQ
jgi:hypothetical protein